MGKIFKALEKAEKQNTVIKKSPKKELDLLRDVQPGTTQVALRNAVNDAPSHAKIKKRQKPSPTIAAPRSIDKNRKQGTVGSSPNFRKPQTTHQYQAKPMDRDGDRFSYDKFGEQKVSDSQLTNLKNAIHADLLSDTEYKPGLNPRQKVKRNEAAYNVKNLNLPLASGGFEERKKNLASNPKKSVNVKYSKTKIQINDPQKLRENNVLSVFEDYETTNQFKILRTQVLRKMKELGGNSILVTSANPCEGKTFTSINLGVSIAKEFDLTVLIIDADIRRPATQHTDFSTEFFSLQVGKGLTDYLVGDADIEEVLINPGIDKLTLIPGGVPVDNSPELLNSPRMEEMMAEIKSRYPSDRVVIVDGPAILHFPDAIILSRYVDGVLPVVESESTGTDDVRRMMAHLKETNILGVVLNKNKG